jgi:hypothetical protein
VLEHLVRSAWLANTTPMIRVDREAPLLVRKALETGAGAVLVSDIGTVAEAGCERRGVDVAGPHQDEELRYRDARWSAWRRMPACQGSRSAVSWMPFCAWLLLASARL